MSNMVTRCPQCQTSFKVTEEHLKIANGAVRCGSCLHVFQARQHWVNPEAAASPQQAATPGKFSFDQSQIDGTTTPAPKPSAAPPASAAAQPEWTPPAAAHRKLEELGDDDRISDDMDLDDDEPELSKGTRPKSASGGSQAAFGTPDDDYSSLFDDADEFAVAEGTETDFSFDVNNFNDLEELAGDESAEEKPGAAQDESWAREMLAELQEEEKPEAVDLSKVQDIREILTDFSNPVDVDAARRDLGFGAEDTFSTSAGRGGSGDRAELIASIERPPVELVSSQPRQKVDIKSLLLLYSATAGLLLLLVLQYVFFHFDALAKSDRTRPYMKSLCSVAFCQLPAVENSRYIKISNLVVRQHPKVADGLSIDAILLNNTQQELAFPQLELYFSDLAKTPIASRRFEPAEYLSGELSGKTTIPPGRPVHIALEIVNPGQDAVNWSLQVAGKVE